MADYSEAASNAEAALTDATDGMIEEYEIRSNGRRVKKGRAVDQLQAAAMLEGLAARRGGGGIFRLAKPANPTT